jgi:hypothetical protein
VVSTSAQSSERAGQPFVHALDLALAGRGRADNLAGDTWPLSIALELHRNELGDAKHLGNRAGDKVVGGGDDQHLGTRPPVPLNQFERLRPNGRAE